MLPSVRLRRSIAEVFHEVNRTATVVCLFLVAVAAADAHPEYAPSTVNRYIKIDLVGPDELRLALHDDGRSRRRRRRGAAPPTPTPTAARRRRDARASASGSSRRCRPGFTLTVDGKRGRAGVRRAAGRPRRQRGGAEPVLGRPRRARAAAPGRAAHAALDDATPEPQLGETEIRVEESPATRLIASHRGRDGDGAARRRRASCFEGPSSPRSRTARSPSCSGRRAARRRRSRGEPPAASALAVAGAASARRRALARSVVAAGAASALAEDERIDDRLRRALELAGTRRP